MIVGAALLLAASLAAVSFFSDRGRAHRPRGGANGNVIQVTPTTDSASANVSVAFIGNSMLYFNDFPRFFETICQGSVTQNSCLHGGASIPSLLIQGNAMYPAFRTPSALLGATVHGEPVYDYGACTVPQLLLGWDDRIHDPGYAQSEDANVSNPCRVDPPYLEYAIETYDDHSNHYNNNSNSNTSNPSTLGQWDYVVINDNTLNPARAATRGHALAFLERFYVDWFLQTGATPVFLWTQAYPPPMNATCSSGVERDMEGLEDVANFTSLTGVGYRAYAALLQAHLPAAQAPRIAPVGLAFLTVREENYDVWRALFHCDGIHASPAGTFLQGCIVHYTLFGTMPDHKFMVRHTNASMAALWRTARVMQHAWDPPNPYPDYATADYLYGVAERVMAHHHVPHSYIHYHNNEAA